MIALMLLLSVVACAAPPGTAPATSLANSPIARVRSVRGQLFVRQRGALAYVPLKAGKAVFGGDIVRTGAGSHAVILLTNRAELELGANMAMEIPLPAEPAKVLPRSRGPMKSRPVKTGANR